MCEDVPLGVVNHGKEEPQAFGAAFFAACPDLRCDVTSRFVAGNRGTAEWTMSGTQRGDLPGLPAAGKHFSLRGMSTFTLQGEKLSRCADYWDWATFQRQLS